MVIIIVDKLDNHLSSQWQSLDWRSLYQLLDIVAIDMKCIRLFPGDLQGDVAEALPEQREGDEEGTKVVFSPSNSFAFALELEIILLISLIHR